MHGNGLICGLAFAQSGPEFDAGSAGYSGFIESMPKTEPCIFPYSTDAISAAFTRACQVLGIDDLHFHDLRHDGVSRLFELGKTIPQTASVSGHRSWSSLKRYTHVRQSGDKYENWQWACP